ncbi:MAG TPA: FAD-dependent oxidoreductase, partial [Rhodospirillaceae bacterium]|nr:FAD-dependent oxidoreductase [Rhodospirillaceae bacterium]
GPDVEWVESINYDVDPDRSDKFYEAVRKYYPELSDGDIYPGYSGIRPKIRGSAYPASDFLIQGPGQHNINGLVNLFGIESPGMTASLAIAEYVKEMILGYK